jgi:hypothetical protein
MLDLMAAICVVPALIALLGAELTNRPPPPAPIYGGSLVEPGDHPAVAALRYQVTPTLEVVCTGTAVAPDIILTAAHCVHDITDPSRLQVVFGDNFKDTAAPSAPAIEVGHHPDFCAPIDECPRHDIFDYGYVKIAGTILLDEFPAPITDQGEWDELMGRGKAITLVGFGTAAVDEDGEPYPTDDASMGPKREVEVEIIDFSPTGYEFRAGGDGKDSCIGDSGGPAFANLDDGSVRLAGVVSRGTVECGGGGFYSVPFPALCWLADGTGTNLLPEGCEDCTCLDTAIPEEEDCGGCGVGHGGPGALVFVLVPLLAHRRRQGGTLPRGRAPHVNRR